MSAPLLYVQSDFDSPEQTLTDWRAAHPLRPVDRVAIALIPIGIACAFILACVAAALLAVIA